MKYTALTQDEFWRVLESILPEKVNDEDCYWYGYISGAFIGVLKNKLLKEPTNCISMINTNTTDSVVVLLSPITTELVDYEAICKIIESEPDISLPIKRHKEIINCMITTLNIVLKSSPYGRLLI